MQSLYDKDYRYTGEAMKLDHETNTALNEIFRRYADAGYSPREIAHIMQAAISVIEMEWVL